MKKLKIFLWLITVVVVVAVGGIVAIVTLVDPNEYKPQIIKQVRDKIGRNLNICLLYTSPSPRDA